MRPSLEEIDEAFKEYEKSFVPLRHGRVGRIHELARNFGFDLPLPTAHDYIDRFAARPEVAACARLIADGLGRGNPVALARKAVRLAEKNGFKLELLIQSSPSR